MTAARVGCSDVTADVSGTRFTGAGARTTRGEVVLGGSAGAFVGKGVAEILRSARFGSRLGLIRAGRTSATVGFCGVGGTIFLNGVLSDDHITTAGIGTSFRRRRSVGASGCTSVCGAGCNCATCGGT